MVEIAASTTGWSAILNADIVIRGVGRALDAVARRKGQCAVSRRYEFTGSNFKDAKVVDLGLDFFMAHQEIWSQILKEYPDRYRFGHSSWDALMLGAFNCIGKDRCFDLTTHRFVFHPRHGERRQAFFIDDTAQTRFRDSVFLPGKTTR